jgi:hypothetical protein
MTRRVSAAALGVDVVRHMLPLTPLYFLHGSVDAFLLLTAFNLALGLMLIVATTRERGDVTTVDPRSRTFLMHWTAILVNMVFLGLVALLVMLPIALPALVLGLRAGVEWRALAARPGVWIPALGMALLASKRAQNLFDERTTVGEKGPASRANPVVGDLEGDRRRSLADYAAQVTLIATYAALTIVLIEFGGWGVYAFPLLYTALLIFFDARPDIGKEIFPKLWQRQ